MSKPKLEVRRRVVPLERVDDVLRVLHLDLLERGVSTDELSSWLWGAHWFPHLKYDDRIVELARSLPEDWQTGTFCDPQVLLRFPHVEGRSKPTALPSASHRAHPAARGGAGPASLGARPGGHAATLSRPCQGLAARW